MNRFARGAACAAVFALAAVRIAAAGGGAAQVFYESMPATVTAGKEIEVPFTVTACGQTMTKLKPRVTARCGREERHVVARSAGQGRYVAKLALPHPGPWTLSVVTGRIQTPNESVVQAVRADVAAGRTASRATR